MCLCMSGSVYVVCLWVCMSICFWVYAFLDKYICMSSSIYRCESVNVLVRTIGACMHVRTSALTFFCHNTTTLIP